MRLSNKKVYDSLESRNGLVESVLALFSTSHFRKIIKKCFIVDSDRERSRMDSFELRFVALRIRNI